MEPYPRSEVLAPPLVATPVVLGLMDNREI